MGATEATDGSVEPEQASGDAHTRNRWRWLDQVLADPELTPFAFQVAYVIASHISRETGDAWPGQARIAEKAKGTERGVRNALDALQARGHLRVDRRQGRRDTNRYRMAIEYRNGGSGNGATEAPSDLFEVGEYRNGGSGSHQSDRNGGSGNGDEYRNHGAGLTGTAVPLIPMREPSERDLSLQKGKQRRRAKRTAHTSDADFDAFWAQVPKATGKLDARRAYDKVIQSGTATHLEIMAGINRYSAERIGQDPRYTKHPATWLNKGCWSDAPQSPPMLLPINGGRHSNGQATETHARPRSGSASAMAGIDAYTARRQEHR